MTLGEWLNRVILDDGPDEDDSPRWERSLEGFPGFGSGRPRLAEEDALAMRSMVERLTERIESAEEQSSSTLTDIDRSLSSLAQRLETTEEALGGEAQATREAVERARAAAEALAARVQALESAEPAGVEPQTLRAVETAFGKLAARLYKTENETGSRLDGAERAAYEAKETIDSAARTLSERIAALENRAQGLAGDVQKVSGRDQRTGEVLHGLHGAMERLRRRVEAAERLTNDAARAVDDTAARLDARLRAVEARPMSNEGVDVERRFDRLADELARVVAETRAQVARELEHAVAEPRVERLEQALASAERRIAAAESGQGEALSRIGMEVTRLARVMDDRLRESERRTLEAVKETRSERELDRRLDAVREENQTAVRRMGEEVAKLGASLADRVNQAERRSAETADAIGARMEAAVAKLHTGGREEDLEARLKQSEARTAERIEAALAGVGAKLEAARLEQADQISPVQRAMNALADRLEAIEQRARPTPPEPVKAASEQPQEPAEEIDFDAPLPPPPEAETPLPEPTEREADPFLVTEAPAPRAAAHPARSYATAPAEPAPIVFDAPEARRPARPPEPQQEARPKPRAKPRQPARLGATADADFLAQARERARGGASTYSGYESSRDGGGRGKALLIVLVLAGFVTLAAAGTILFWDTLSGAPAQPARIEAADIDAAFTPTPSETPPATEESAGLRSTETAPVDVAEAAPEDVPAAPEPIEPPARTAATAPQDQTASLEPTATYRRPTMEEAAAAGDPVARYQLGLARLQAGDASAAAALLRRAAEQGVPAAQYRYAKMLETGEGVPADLEAARRWTQTAAEAGNRRAMHNMGVLLATGAGAEQDYASAAQWFEQAALLGLADSQFNLAILFEQGLGLEQSAPDAYAWYSIAARSGDQAARDRADSVGRTLAADARAEADAVVARFTPRPMDEAANGIYPERSWGQPSAVDSAMIRRAQSLLSALGYDPGPADGQPGAQTRQAVLAYEAAQGLPRTGEIDAVLLGRLERAAAE